MIYSDIFVELYDSIMGDRISDAKKVHELILINSPKAKTVLEIACGTGSILNYFGKIGFEIYGTDISENMINVAKRKNPTATLLVQDMRDICLEKKFDVILCLFDSINHLLKIDDWEMVFKTSYNHLNAGGIFIFDINTINALSTLAKSSGISKTSGNNSLNMKVVEQPNGIFDWNTDINVRQDDGSYINHKEIIKETSFPLTVIEDILHKQFIDVRAFDQKNSDISEQSKRVYFVCKK